MITLEIAQAKLTLWLEAEERVASGQKYAIDVDGSRRELERADLSEIAKRIEYWSGQVVALTRRGTGRSNSRYIRN